MWRRVVKASGADAMFIYAISRKRPKCRAIKSPDNIARDKIVRVTSVLRDAAAMMKETRASSAWTIYAMRRLKQKTGHYQGPRLSASSRASTGWRQAALTTTLLGCIACTPCIDAAHCYIDVERSVVCVSVCWVQPSAVHRKWRNRPKCSSGCRFRRAQETE